MGKIDPALLTVLVSSGLLAALTQIALAIAALIRQKANKAELSSKIDDNTQMTADIHKVTNGPFSNMENTVKGIVTQAATNAAIASAAVEAAKTQAVVDANRIPLAKPPEKP